MSINDYIKSELLVLIPVLYLIGSALKNSTIKDKLIPLILGGSGIALATLWVFATSDFESIKDVATGIFTSITQGVLVAGASVYFNQVVKQVKKGESDE